MSFSTSLDAYNVGDTVRLTFTVKTSTGGPVDTSVRLVVGNSTNAGTAYTTSSMTHVGTGSWRKDIRVDAAGRWSYRWQSTGAVVQVDEGAFAVSRVKAATA
jgi:hypothetical protein